VVHRGLTTFVALFSIVAAACTSVDDAQAVGDPSPPPTVTESVDGLATAAYIFDQDELRTYELVIAEENLATLDADPAAEEYVDGTLLFEGQELSGVGVRYKGSIGAFVGCLDGPNLFEPSGAKTCTKLSMKVKITHTDQDLEFFGQRRLQFHAMNLDPTQMRERLGYWLFAEMGVPAPRAVHARLLINDEFVGVFALVEQIDGRFTRANFDDGTGNLYKEVWPTSSAAGSDDEPTPISAYADSLRTNEDGDPSFEIINGFAQAILDASPDERGSVLAQYMDVEALLAYTAVDRTIRHDDGPFHFYCDERCSAHNFFLYEDPAAGELHLIPWDLDNTFQNIPGPANPITPIPHEWNEIENDCDPFAFGALGILQRSAACDPVFAALATFEEEYESTRDAFIQGPFADETVTALLDSWADQIAEATAKAEELHVDALTTAKWGSALDGLRADLTTARN
jgi:spore coat protein CotH